MWMLVIYVGAVDPITWVKAGHSAPSITLRSSSRGTTGTPLVLPVCDRLKPLEAYWHVSAVKIGEVGRIVPIDKSANFRL